ncbi:MAG TPA: hypothetical protein V6D17_16535 [Candidatus Obscuribacterales bacterium]
MRLNPRLAWFLLLVFCAAPAALAAAEASAPEIITLLRAAKIVNPSYRLDVVTSGREITVITKRNPKATDDDCKINAVLMGKAVMDAHPTTISRVKVLYAPEGMDAVDEVVVRAGDVRSYDAGSITEDQLLSSLELKRIAGANLGGASGADKVADAVASGPFEERRLTLLLRIEDLAQKGTGVEPFRKRFKEIEDRVRAGNSKDLSSALDDLASKVGQQEELRRQAQNVGAGRGVFGAHIEPDRKGGVGSAVPETGPLKTSAKSDTRQTTQATKLRPEDQASQLARFKHKMQMLNNQLQRMRDNGIATGDIEARMEQWRQFLSNNDFAQSEKGFLDIVQMIAGRQKNNLPADRRLITLPEGGPAGLAHGPASANAWGTRFPLKKFRQRENLKP